MSNAFNTWPFFTSGNYLFAVVMLPVLVLVSRNLAAFSCSRVFPLLMLALAFLPYPQMDAALRAALFSQQVVTSCAEAEEGLAEWAQTAREYLLGVDVRLKRVDAYQLLVHQGSGRLPPPQTTLREGLETLISNGNAYLGMAPSCNIATGFYRVIQAELIVSEALVAKYAP